MAIEISIIKEAWRAGLQNSGELQRVAEQFLIDLANGVQGNSCPDDTFATPSVFDMSYKG